MNCEAYREEYSARLDREDPLLRPGVLDAHLSRCRDCAEWAEGAARLHRAVRVAAAPTVADLVEPIMSAALRRRRATPATFDSGALARVARLVLASIGFAELVAAAPGLFARGGAGTGLHAIHELGSFDLALAVGFLTAALRPSLAKGTLPLVVALVGALAVVTVLDVIGAHAGWGAESVHVLSVLGIPMLWLAGRSEYDLAERPGRTVAPPLRLRAARPG